MSGGHFCDYAHFRIYDFGYLLEQELAINKKDYGEEVISILKKTVPEIYRMVEVLNAIDYLYDGDYGEESFLEKMKEIEQKYSGQISL
jgi:hypothetical protein